MTDWTPPPPPTPLRRAIASALMLAMGMFLGWLAFVAVPHWWSDVMRPMLCGQ